MMCPRVLLQTIATISCCFLYRISDNQPNSRACFIFVRRNVPPGEAEAILYYSGIKGIWPSLSCHTASNRLLLLVQKG